MQLQLPRIECHGLADDCLRQIHEVLDKAEAAVARELECRREAGLPTIEIYPEDLYLLRSFGFDVDLSTGQIKEGKA